MVARDFDFSEVRVDRESGRVEGVDLASGEAQLLGPTLAGFEAVAAAYSTAFQATRGTAGIAWATDSVVVRLARKAKIAVVRNIARAGWEKSTRRLLRKIQKRLLEDIKAVDPSLVRGETFWTFHAEELGSGIIGADEFPVVKMTAEEVQRFLPGDNLAS